VDFKIAVLLLVLGSVLLIVGLWTEASIYQTISGDNAVVNESINITNGANNTLAYTGIVSGSYSITNTTGTALPTANYTIDRTGGIVRISSFAASAGKMGYISYTWSPSVVQGDSTYTTMNNIQTNVNTAFTLGGISLIVIGAASILKTLLAGFGA
jgi:hypothetical protein